MLYSMCGVETDNILLGNAQVTAALETQNIVTDSSALSEDRGDVSSPKDITHLLEVIYRGQMHSPRSREAVMDILSRQQFKAIIPADLPLGTKVAHKTGGMTTVRCDAGIVFSPSGPYCVAIMAKHVTDMKTVDASLAAISKSVYDHFNH